MWQRLEKPFELGVGGLDLLLYTMKHIQSESLLRVACCAFYGWMYDHSFCVPPSSDGGFKRDVKLIRPLG